MGGLDSVKCKVPKKRQHAKPKSVHKLAQGHKIGDVYKSLEEVKKELAELKAMIRKVIRQKGKNE